jgi:hypothetical protein
VPAGKFTAIPLTTVTERKVSVKTTVWIAPNVGVAKQVTASGPVEGTQVLKSFSPGK